MHSSTRAIATRPTAWRRGCCAPRPGYRSSCRSCTAFPGAVAAGARIVVAAGLRGQQARAHRQRRDRAAASSTSTARSWTPCTRRAKRSWRRSSDAWRLQKTLLKHLERVWDEPDQGIWEVRGPPRHFTHSRLMCWVAFDRAMKSCERLCSRRLARALARRARPDQGRHLRQRLRPRTQHVRPALRRQVRSTRRYCSCRSSAFCRPMIRASWARSPPSSASLRRRIRDDATRPST